MSSLGNFQMLNVKFTSKGIQQYKIQQHYHNCIWQNVPQWKKAVEKLNTLQDEREKYFSQKMQKLMAEPFVIRCFNHKSEGKKNDMEYKRKQIQQILSYQNQKSNPERLQQMMNQYGQKQKKIKCKIEKIMQQHEKSLQQRIKKRASLKPDRLSYIESSIQGSTNKKNQEKDNEWERDLIKILPFNPENLRTSQSTSSEIIQIPSP